MTGLESCAALMFEVPQLLVGLVLWVVDAFGTVPER